MRWSILVLALVVGTSAFGGNRIELNATGVSRAYTFFPLTQQPSPTHVVLVGGGFTGAYLFGLSDADRVGPILTLQVVANTAFLDPKVEGYAGATYERLAYGSDRFRLLFGITAAWAVTTVTLSDVIPAAGPMARARVIAEYRMGQHASVSLAPEIAALFVIGWPVLWQPMLSVGVSFD